MSTARPDLEAKIEATLALKKVASVPLQRVKEAFRLGQPAALAEQYCALVDRLYEIAFCDGAEWSVEEAKKVIRGQK